MKTRKTPVIFVACVLFLALFAAFQVSTANSAPFNSPFDEEKLRGLVLHGNPAAEHRVFIAFEDPPGLNDKAFVQGLGGSVRYVYHLVPAIAATIPEAAIDHLLRNPRVASIEPDGRVQAIDTELDNTWGVKRIGAGLVHDSGNRGAGVKVAVVDSGIDYNHSDLALNFDPANRGYDFVNEDPDPMDDYGHGTHVAGTVAARDDGVGVVGAAPEARLYALKVLDSRGSGWWSDVIAALEWSVNNGIDVTNNSYAGTSDTDSSVPEAGVLQQAFDNSYNQGVLHVAASGNYSWFQSTSVRYPAKFDSVIAVGATDSSNNRASFSCYGPELELAAPGVNINSTKRGGGYELKSGTSMASPHVAGTAALVLASDLNLTNDEVRQRLKVTADDLGAAGWDQYFGFGLVDADEAALEPAPPPPPVVMHVGDLDGAKTVTARYWKAFVTITVHDAAHNPVEGATVQGAWSGGYAGSAAATTGSSGTCTVSTGSIPKKKTSVTFTVSNITKTGDTYNSSANHDPDGDSNGTSITISK
jgi:subtilisin